MGGCGNVNMGETLGVLRYRRKHVTMSTTTRERGGSDIDRNYRTVRVGIGEVPSQGKRTIRDAKAGCLEGNGDLGQDQARLQLRRIEILMGVTCCDILLLIFALAVSSRSWFRPI